MPNWSEGCLKVRGKVANVKKFVLEGLKPVDVFGNELHKLELSDCEDDETFTATLDAKFAWAADAEKLSALCKKYSIDMKLYAFEKGMEFNQDILIVDGEILRDNVVRFEDYEWECICPALGG